MLIRTPTPRHLVPTLPLRSLLLATALLVCCARPGQAPPSAPASPTAVVITPSAGTPSGGPSVVAEAATATALPDESALRVSPADPSTGSVHALATLVVFGDLQCPFTARWWATLEQLRKRYPADSLRIVWKNLPLAFHAEARPAAEAAMAVHALGGSDAFFCFAGALFADQRDLGPGLYERAAQRCGVSPLALRAESSAGRAARKVADDAALAASVGVTGTPTSLVNGTHLSGAQPIEPAAGLVDGAIDDARDALAAGVPRDRLHAELVKANLARERPAAAAAAPEPADTKIYKVPVAGSPVLGPPTALVTVVVFSDFQCPFCKRAAERIAELRTRYGPKIRFVFKNQPLPFHQRAEPAAQLALEARAAQGDAGFWRAHDALFASAPALDDADLDQVARSSKLDPVVARAAIGAHKHRASIQADTKLAEQLGVSGTPQFFVNGRKLVGAQPLAAFEALVDEVLPAAQALVARGVPAARVYEETIKNGVTAPSGGKGAAAPVDTAVYKVPVAGSPVLGPAAAPVTIVMFTDFQCPFCKRAVATLEELRKRRPAQVRLVFKHNPLSFHPRAEPASQLALEARAQQGDAGFWRAYEELFASAPALDDADLDAVSASLRLDGARVRGAIATHRHAAAIAADQALAGQLGAAGTPTFFVNGKILVGAQPIDKFEQIVDEVLPAAQALLKRGVPAARVYDETIKSGKSAKP